MRMKVYFTITSIIIAALVFTGFASQTFARDVHKRPAKVRKRVQKRTVSHVCPMHPDMRSTSPGECPKCGMDLVRERRSRKS